MLPIELTKTIHIMSCKKTNSVATFDFKSSEVDNMV